MNLPLPKIKDKLGSFILNKIIPKWKWEWEWRYFRWKRSEPRGCQNCI